MRSIGCLAFVLFVAAALPVSPASANTCRAGKLTCATTMPIDGYCECRSHGATEGGTVVAKPESKRPVNSTAGGCGSDPKAPGCR